MMLKDQSEDVLCLERKEKHLCKETAKRLARPLLAVSYIRQRGM